MNRAFLDEIYTVAQDLADHAARLVKVIEREVECAGGVIVELPADDDWKAFQAFLDDHPELQ